MVQTITSVITLTFCSDLSLPLALLLILIVALGRHSLGTVRAHARRETIGRKKLNYVAESQIWTCIACDPGVSFATRGCCTEKEKVDLRNEQKVRSALASEACAKSAWLSALSRLIHPIDSRSCFHPGRDNKLIRCRSKRFCDVRIKYMLQEKIEKRVSFKKVVVYTRRSQKRDEKNRRDIRRPIISRSVENLNWPSLGLYAQSCGASMRRGHHECRQFGE